MSDLELGLPTREPPLDSVLDGYYSGHQYTDKAKLSAIKNVMKSAISITKSKTGKVILKTNRLEGERLKCKLNIVKKERTFAEVDLNKTKIVFKAQYGKWMNLKNLQPIEIKDIKSKYKLVRKKIKQKEVAKQTPNNPDSKWSKVPHGPIPVMGKIQPKQEEKEGGLDTTRFSTEKTDSHKKSTVWDSVYWSTQWDVKAPKTPQEKYPYSLPRTETASRNGSRQRKRMAALWREETFDMGNIRDLLEDQHLKQESLLCKHQIDRWKTHMLDRQKTIDQELKLTVTQREKSPVSISSDSNSDLSSNDADDHPQTVFPDLRHKQTPVYAANKDSDGTRHGYKNMSVTFCGKEMVSVDRENKRNRKIQSRASVGGDRNVNKQLSGALTDRTDRRLHGLRLLGNRKEKSVL